MGGVLVLLTTLGVVIELAVSGVGGDGDRDGSVSASAGSTGSSHAPDEDAPAGPVPGDAPGDNGDVGALPDGGAFSTDGDGGFHGVGTPGATAGDPDRDDADTYSYVVEVEDGVDTSSFGGGDAFSSSVDATLGDPRSWISNGTFAFRHTSVDEGQAPDLRVRLTSPETARELCGGHIELETSCFIQGPDSEGDDAGAAEAGRVILNVARWVRGASTFEGDLGAYRQYLVNHEVGHGIGFAAHQACPRDGVLAPVMMQQTLSMNNGELEDLEAGAEYEEADGNLTCRPNAWPYPHGRGEGEAVDVRD